MGYSISGPNKVITLTAGTTNISVRDLWSRWIDWFLISDNSKYLPAFESVGGNTIDLSAGTYIPIYAFLINGWKLKPQESNHTLNVTDGVLLVSGGGDPFINTTGSYIVRINYQQPVQAISYDSGGGGGSAPTVQQIREEIDANSIKLELVRLITDELHKLQGLDSDNPMTVTTSTRTAGDIVLHIAGDGENISIVTRE
jgi:hypothetical protein